jgi:hypothetical protein
MQQKQMRIRSIIPTMTPITIPAIAPPLRPWLLLATMGIVLPLAVAGGINAAVVVADTVEVAVLTPPLVGRIGAEYEELVLIAVSVG